MIADAIKISIEKLIKPFEGYHKALPDGRCQAYPDPGSGGNPWTIGYGSTGPNIVPGTIWTKDQAELDLLKKVAFFTKGVVELSPEIVLESSNKLAALISFCYNCGLGNYKISRLRLRVNEKEWEEAAEMILLWNKAAGKVMSGLTKRRKAESLLLLL